MKSIKEISQEMNYKMFEGMKIPHTISNPVIRIRENEYDIAYFGYSYSKKNLEEKMCNRPTKWGTVDIETGEIKGIISCEQRDFAHTLGGEKCSIDNSGILIPDERYFEEMDKLFDLTRKSIIDGKLDDEIYREYLVKLLAITPVDYKMYYKKLIYNDEI